MAFFQEFFSGGLKSIVKQIYIVMLIFILFLDQIPEGAKGEFFSGGGGGICLGGLWKKASLSARHHS